jgi:signal transduction histidine kinase
VSANDKVLLLIVDDDEPARYAKSRILRREGFEVIEAGTARDTLRLVAERQPNIVLLDVNLPDMSGWDVCRMLKSDPATATMPVLQMSASYVTEADTVRALEGGADACLTEPAEPPVLIATVRALLRARTAEERLRQALGDERAARSAAEAASRDKDEFLATLSHELRSPLNAILTWVTLARSGRLDQARTAHALEVIERNTRLQVRMIEELLDVSRIIAGKMHLERSPIELEPVLRAALDGVQLLAEQKQVRLATSIPADAGPVFGDAARLEQVFSNLLSNAVKFTPRGGSVSLTVANDGDAVEATVADTGRGIPPEHLPRIFDRFRQVDASTTRSEGGLGLGLAIVRHLVEQHGGQVSAESAGIGAGATFRVRLPRGTLPATPAARDAVETTHADAGASPADLRGVHVLLVDDEGDAREAVAILLAQAGAHVTQASSAAEAWNALETLRPDVVVSDLAMPFEDGFSLLRRLRDADADELRRLPVIALTAYSSEDDLRRIAEAGFDLQIPKPTEVGDLAEGVRVLLSRAR